MEYQKYMILSILLMLIVLPLSHAVWTPPNYYTNVYNVTVNNWNYTATYGSSVFTGFKTGWVLVGLHNVSNPLTLQLNGYSKSLQNLGLINWYLVEQNGANVIVLIDNKTQQNISWSTASIFYNPIKDTESSSLLNPNQNISSYKGIEVELIGSNYSRLGQTPYFSNNTFYNLSFIYNASSFVLLSNVNFTKQSISSTWSPTSTSNFDLYSNTLSHNYILKDNGFLGQYVSNTPLVSQNANFLYSNYSNANLAPVYWDKLGYEGYFNSQITNNPTNTVIAEGMLANSGGHLYNSTTTKNTGISLIPRWYFNLTTNAIALPVSLFMIMPAFTRNYSITENSLISNVTSNFTFAYYLPVYNINWTYTYNTYAYPTSENSLFGVTFNSVGYLFLKIPHYPEMNNYCQSLYVRGFNPATKFLEGTIPFSVYNCTPNNPIATILISNKTSDGFTFNALRIYFNSTTGDTTEFSNSMVLTAWNFNNSVGGFLNTSNSLLPYIVTTSAPLNTVSNVMLKAGSHTLYIAGFNGIQTAYLECNIGGFGSCAAQTPDYANYPTQTFLFAHNLSIGGNLDLWDLISTNLIGYWRYTPTVYYSIIGNTLTTIQSGSHVSSPLPSESVVYTGNFATSSAYKLYTTNAFVANYVVNIGGQGLPCLNNCLPNLPINTTNNNRNSSINYTNTTTIVPNTNLIHVYSDFSVPEFVTSILAIICVLIGAFTFSTGKDGHYSFIFIIIALWIIGIFQFINGYSNLLVLGMIVTVLFILFEVIEGKNGKGLLVGVI